MLYSNVEYTNLMKLRMTPLWYARFTDHPKYTTEALLEECSIEDLIVLPTEAMIVDEDIHRDSYYSSTIVDIEIRFEDRADIIRYTTYDEKIFSILVEHGYIIGDSQEEVFEELEKQLEFLVEEYLDFSDKDRYRWYVECLGKVNPKKANAHIEEYPELFV